MPYRTPKRPSNSSNLFQHYDPPVAPQDQAPAPGLRTRSKSAPHLHRRNQSQPQSPEPYSHFSRRRRRAQRFSRRAKPLPYVDVRVVDFIKVPNRLGQPKEALSPVDDTPRPPAYDLASPRRVLENEHIFDVDALENALGRTTLHDSSKDTHPDSKFFMLDDNGHSERIFRIVSNVNRNSGEDGVQNFGAQRVQDDVAHQFSDDDSVDPDFDYNPADARKPPSTILGRVTNVQPCCPPKPDRNDLTSERTRVDVDENESVVSSLIETVSIVDSADIMTRTFTPTDRACRSITSIASAGIPSSLSSMDNSHSPQSRLVVANATNGPTGTHVAITQRRYAPDLLQKHAPTPVKYTFKPILSAEEIDEAVCMKLETPTVSPASTKPTSFDRNESVMSNISASQSTSHPTLRSVKSVVESIDPRHVLSMAGTPSLAVAAAVGIFRRTSAKRESDESATTTSTEYYEDDYTKFIEKKRVSPLRRRHPHIKRMIFSEGRGSRHHHSRMECRSNSPVSLATSDEEYAPAPMVKT